MSRYEDYADTSYSWEWMGEINMVYLNIDLVFVYGMNY